MAPWILKKLNATVLPEILAPVLFFTLIATLLAVLVDQTDAKVAVNPIALSILTTMLSFAISLRTSSALERYGEGRKAWTQLTRISRDFSTLVWLHTPPTTLTADELKDMPRAKEEEERCRALLEKRTIIGLIQAFSVAAKHYLRNEHGPFHDDLYHLIACLPRYSFPSSVDSDVTNDAADRSHISGLWRAPGPNGVTFLPYDGDGHVIRGAATPETSHSTMFGAEANFDVEKADSGLKRSKIPLAPGYNPPRQTIYTYAPVFKVIRPIIRMFSKTAKEEFKQDRQRRSEVGSNIPLEISLFLSGYVAALVQRNTLSTPFYSIFMAQVAALQDAISTLERVVTTPLPFAYSMHLRATTYVYLIFLPFQIYSALKYLTIPAVAIASIVFLGFLELGTQLENPFGFDDSDLNLDGFCQLIERELREIVAHPQPAPSTYVFSPLNTPFLPSDPRSAPEILNDLVVAQDGTQARGVPLLRKMFAQQFSTHESIERNSKSKRKPVGPSRSVDVFSV